MYIENKKILLTGANGAIGSALKEKLENYGSSVISIVNNAKKFPKDITADISTADGIEIVLKIIEKENFDIIINLAGINNFVEFDKQSLYDINKIMQINLLSPMLFSNAALKLMVAKKSGHIVNVGSIMGSLAMPYFASYCTSKAGLKAFSESLYREYNAQGINITYIAPRAVKTPMNAGKAGLFNRRTKTTEDSVDTVVEKIINAIEYKKPRCFIGFAERFFVKLNAVAPCLVDSDMFKKAIIAKNILEK
jgi:short-subunit dehydrogenase